MSRTESEVRTGVATEKRDKSRDLTADQAYHLLQNQRRRNVLRYLRDADGPVEMRDVAEQVAAWENNTTVTALSSDARQRTYIPLYQSHLPKLDEEGVIDYDQSRGIIEPTPLVEELNEYLSPSTATETNDEEDEHAGAWGRYYLGASGVGTAVLVGATQGLTPFAALSSTSAGVIVLAMFWTLTLGQDLTDRQNN
ncbi:DUF7344 domain-containing protein [Halomicrococcus sp. NG-SE-24]|uniref:DUF7344 domain-containing protein n=1 Tax=Halomicrococcus sp. NG-SE-24 TaxID=3436928 RepID=UPI003D99B55A